MRALSRKIGGRIHVDASRSAVPRSVGPYRLCFELGSGGMATVFLAHEETSGASPRFAAVKLIHPHLASDPTFRAMFADEAEIASRIRHPHVCAVHGFDVSASGSYLAMEYLLGESMGAVWRKLHRSRPGDGAHARFVAKALADACEGLHAAHELTDAEGEPLEIVHRDVSPGNVLLTYDGVAKVLDFGVAAAACKQHRTQTGTLKGKVGYIAPECLLGQRADRRSDVWALGVTAWELVTARRLFHRASDVDTLRAVMDAPIAAPSAVQPGLSRELDDVLMLALQRDPADRYETARDLGRDLARVASGGELVTAADLAEWLERLFPGRRARKEQLLELAAQMATDGSTPRVELASHTPTHMASIVEPAPELAEAREPTRVYEPESSAAPALPAPHREARRPAWPMVLALAIGVASGGAATYAMTARVTGQREPPREGREVPIASAAPRAPDPRSELRVRAGSGIARGPYLLEIVESGGDDLLLRIRRDDGGEPDPDPAAEVAAPASR